MIEKFNATRKALAAAVTVLAGFVTTVTTSDSAGVTEGEWGLLVIGLLGVFSVWLVPNDPQVPVPPPEG